MSCECRRYLINELNSQIDLGLFGVLMEVISVE